MPSVLGKIGIAIASLVGIYSIILGALLTPYLQRFSLYAHKINTLFYHDINQPEDFGFAKTQVTPFNIRTLDGEVLYAWHILPIDVYTHNEAALLQESRPLGPVEDFTQTTAFKLLASNSPSPARVVVSFHGNAGHVAQGYRTDTHRLLTALPNTHVITIDYRGFGHSTGSPTEEGLIFDGVAVMKWVMHVARVPPDRIVILGQSLGTAVAAAVGAHFADPKSELLLEVGNDDTEGLRGELDRDKKHPVTFAGIILVAPFSSLPSLMLTYRIGGFIPILLPFRPLPMLARYVTGKIVDTWQTAERLAGYHSALSAHKDIFVGGGGRTTGSVQILHAVNDWDITYRQSEIICRRMLSGKGDGHRCSELETAGALVEVSEIGRPRLRFEILGVGGHNEIMTFSPVAAAVVRAFENL